MTNIVWSKNGVLAYARGPTVCFTCLERLDGVSWQLAPPVKINVGRDVAFLSFGPHFDLAVVDETGRIEIIEILPGGHYKIKVPWLSVADPRSRPAELDKVVKLCWLNNDKSLGLPTSVPKVQKPQPGQPAPNTKAVWNSIKPSGPLHPVHGKTCLLAVTGNGMLRIISEGDDFTEVSVPLPTNSVVRAAAFTATGETMMMAAYCESHVMLFDIKIKFQGAQIEEKSVRPIAACAVTEPLDGELTVFEIIQSPSMPQVRPIVHAIFNVADTSQVLIFKLMPWTEKLHPALAAAQPVPVQPTARAKLFLSDSRTTSKKIKSYCMLRTAIVIIYCDNTIESQNLISVPMLLPGRDLQFQLQSGEFCFSPNVCMAAQLCPSSETPVLHHLSCKIVSPEKLAELPTLIATSYAYSVYNYIHCDDLLQLIWTWTHVDLPQRNAKMNIATFKNLVTTESQRLLNVPFDPTDDPRQTDKFIVIPSSLQRWLMLQMELGTGKNWARTPSSLMAWMGLNIQYLAFVTKWTLRRVAAKQPAPQNPQQQLAQIALHCYHINSMLGLLQWFTDLVAHLTKEIFLATVQPGATNSDSDPKTDPSVQYLCHNSGSFVNVLLSKIMRWLLIFIIRGVKGIETILVHMMNQERQLGTFGVAMLTHKRFTTICNGIIPLDQFDGILKEIDKRLQTLYKNDQMQDRVKQALELELIKNNQTPALLLPVVSQIVLLFKRLLSTIKIPNLYFYDTSWLLLDEHQVIGKDKIDAIKKFVIKSTSKQRVCTRCGQPSAIETARQKQLNQVGSLFNRNCLCGGMWKDVTI